MTPSGMVVCPSCAAQAASDSGACANCGAALANPYESPEVSDLVAELGRAVEGRYLLGRVLGTGHGGVTIEARHVASKRNVALKVAWNDTVARKQVLRETVLSAQVPHPNVVSMRDVAAPESLLVVEMPLISGGTLADLLAQYGPVPFANVVEILRCIAGALDQAHSAGIIHGGLQPAKVLLDGDGRPLVSDFAIRVPRRADWDVDRPSEVGAQAYMPLEQRHDSPSMDGRVDQYALAIMAYELLRGHPTWRYTEDAGIEIDAIEIIVHRPVVHDAPVVAGAAIKRAISKDPGFRFASTSEFVRAFSGATVDGAPLERTHHTELATVAKRSRAWILVPLVIGAAVLAMQSDIRNSALGLLGGLWPFGRATTDNSFQIDTTISEIKPPIDSTPAVKKSGQKSRRDSTKRNAVKPR